LEINMSATIYTNGTTGTKRVQLSNGQMCRRMIYLNNWTTMRIGLRLTVPSASSIAGTPRLWVGVGSGLTNAIGDASTTNWIGIYTDSATWTRSTLVSPAIGYFAATGRSVKRVGTTVTQNAAGFGQNLVFPMSDTFLTVLLVEITKGSPNYTINIGAAGSSSAFNGAALPGITEANMDAFMSLPIGMSGITAVVNTSYSTPGAQTLAMSEAAGNLDTIQVYWDKTTAPCEVESIYHRKLA
jgi:hypothetical protein